MPSSVEHIIRACPRDLGGFMVRRVLPAVEKQMVGPFIFVDHMGPISFEPRTGIDVRPHPHIGLATVTYLFEGELVHRDSLGSVQPIRPGDVNWMLAGRGIAHSERTPPELRPAGSVRLRMAFRRGSRCRRRERRPSRRSRIIPLRRCRSSTFRERRYE